MTTYFIYWTASEEKEQLDTFEDLCREMAAGVDSGNGFIAYAVNSKGQKVILD